MEIGIDIVDISGFHKDIVFKKNILKRIFTKKEMQYCEKKANASQHYAVRFAGKEAVVKALSCYDVRIALNKIEILSKKNGIPYINILDKNIKNFEIKISLSHSDKTAIAVAVIYKKSKD